MATTKWVIDPVHSEIGFRVKHLMITTVTGYFRKFNLEVETAGDSFDTATKIEFSADISSIDTNNEQRDTHLKSADFFNSEEHAQLTFVGSKYKSNGKEATVNGELTIRGTSKPFILKLEYGGVVVDPYGQTKAGFSMEGKISRKEFGLNWSAITEAGNLVVSDDIKIHAEVQLIKQVG